MMFRFLLLVTSLALIEASDKPLGVVFWHGMGDTSSGGGMTRLSQMIKDEIPGTYVLSVKLGSSSLIDFLNSYLMPINQQIETVCQMVHSDPNLSNGFHLIGISQAGLFVRALAQRCPPKVLGSVISIGGPQQGVYGLPQCPNATANPFCQYIRRALSKFAYTDFIQSKFTQAQYWHDPLNEAVYKDRSQFLADINQEKTVNVTYRNNLLTADNLVLVRFLHDTIVIPGASEWFGFYRPGSADTLYDTKESSQYKTDSLGLRTLDKQGRLHLIPLPGNHLQFSDEWFRDVIIKVFLNGRTYT
uniref:Palmitoyl-protein thioesterase 1 n=1 Tax=Mesocestoides corti TaxID=53468 RepID=A0A5K3FBD6_MESCO